MPTYAVYGERVVKSVCEITFEADSLEHAKELLKNGNYEIDDIDYDNADETFDIDESSVQELNRE